MPVAKIGLLRQPRVDLRSSSLPRAIGNRLAANIKKTARR